MRRNILVFIITGLLIFSIASSIFAFPNPSKPIPKPQPQMAPAQVGRMGFMGPVSMGGLPGQDLGPNVNPELRDAHLKLMIAKALNAMELERNQIEDIYNILSNAKKDLEEIDNKILEEYQDALEAVIKGKEEDLKKAQKKIDSLLKERDEIRREVLEQIKSKITVDQLEKLMKYFQQNMKSRFENNIRDLKDRFEGLTQRLRERLSNNNQFKDKNFPKFREFNQEKLQEMLMRLRDSMTKIFENRLVNILLSDQFIEVLEMYLE